MIKYNNNNRRLFSASEPHEQYSAIHSELSGSTTLNEFKERIHHIIKQLEFTDFLFLRLERTWAKNWKNGLLYTLPEEFMQTYIEDNMYKTDLLIAYGKDNIQPIFSSQVYGYINEAPFETELTRDNRILRQLYGRFDYLEHCAIPMPACNNNGHVQLLLTSMHINQQRFQSLVTPIIPICRTLCKAIDSVSTEKFSTSFIDDQDNPINITPKPRQLLYKLANSDISITDIAKEMSISPITAHQHLSSARKALGVKTNRAAVIKAIKAGIINLE